MGTGLHTTTFVRPIGFSPKVFLSDNENALRTAFAELWPDVPRLLCLWHVNKNVQDHLQKHFKRLNGPFDLTDQDKAEQRQKRDQFMAGWAGVNRAKTQVHYEERWAVFTLKYHEYPAMIR